MEQWSRVSHVTTFDFFSPKYSSNSNSSDTPPDSGQIWPESDQNLTSFFFSFVCLFVCLFDEQIWGPIREWHEAGVGGGQFTGSVWVRR
jgi:hypothetical protein